MLDETKPLWPDVDHLQVDGLALHFDEFVFFHRPSRSLIVADLVANVRRDVHGITKLFFRIFGAYPGPRIPSSYSLAVRDKRRLCDKLDRILTWDFDRVIVGHGDVVESGGKAVFERACREFLA